MQLRKLISAENNSQNHSLLRNKKEEISIHKDRYFLISNGETNEGSLKIMNKIELIFLSPVLDVALQIDFRGEELQ